MLIQVLGSGCPACQKLFETTQKAAVELGLETDVAYISGNEATQKIIALGLMTSPVLLIDDKVAMTGATTNVDKVKAVITKGMCDQDETCGGDCCCCGGSCRGEC